ncbi:MAG: hypothetical protein QM831_21075 [Kofleriaceae bacterium]
MIRWLILLASATAVAAPTDDLRPHDTHSFDNALVRTVTKGTGRAPEYGDEVTYTWTLYRDRDPRKGEHITLTRRLDLEDGNWYARYREQLHDMREGEVRLMWFAEQDGNLCDHFGCAGPPTKFAAKLELLTITRHVDVLPDDMHVTLLPSLSIQRGRQLLDLGSGYAHVQLASVALANETVVIETDEQATYGNTKPTHVTRKLPIAEIRARFSDDAGLAAAKHHEWKKAKELFTTAVDLAPQLDLPHLHLAMANAHLGLKVDLTAMDHDPAGFYFRIHYDPLYEPLKTNPLVKELNHGKGEITALGYNCEQNCMEVDATGRFVAVPARYVTTSENVFAWNALRIVDVQTGAVIDTVQAALTDSSCDHCPEYLAAKAMLVDLGFKPVIGHARIEIDEDDVLKKHVRIRFPDLTLARAADKPRDATAFRAIELPERQKILEAIRVGQVILVRWAAIENEYIDVTVLPK